MPMGENHVLIAGRSALPLLVHRLANLRGARTLVLCECGETDDVNTSAHVELHRIPYDNDRPYALYETLRGLHLPQGDTWVWLACGRIQAAMIRRQLIADHGVALHRIESPVMETLML